MKHKARIPSNRMPKSVHQQTGVIGWIVLGAFGAGVVYLFSWHPVTFAVALIIAAVYCMLIVADRQRTRRIAIERHGESICSFARWFDCRATDTWIVRAVFEELVSQAQFPIRPDDRLEDDLEIDSEDLDDIAETIAQRTGRPLDDSEANPLYGKIVTVRDLAEFFVHQARRKVPAG